jgi:hypothetical protein
MATKKEEVSIMEVSRGRVEFLIRGTSPLILNAMSAKIHRQLLLPPVKKNAAEKASTLKHEPLSEFRNSMYKARDAESPTRVVMPATAFKGALMSAALDLPGATKSSIGRLTFVEGDEVCIYGVPELMMSITRCADIKRTPDVRTRAVMPQWAARISVVYTKPLLKQQSVVNLMAAAGIMQGVGDWRVGKGNGAYGSFELVSEDDEIAQSVIANGGKDAQDAAIENPVAFDSETDELLSWFDAEVRRRGFRVAS